MSGPCTAILLPSQVLPVLLAASAIRAARAVQEAGERATALRADHLGQRQQQAGRQAAAAAQGLEALQAAGHQHMQEIGRLNALATQLGADQALTAHQPAPPAGAATVQAWAAHVQELQGYVDHARQALLAVLAQTPSSETQEPDTLDIEAAVQELSASLDLPVAEEALAAAPRRSQRLLARVAALGSLPEPIMQLAQELDAVSAGERAQLLASELRLQLQHHAEQSLQAQVRAAQAEVLQQSLLDLGYEVESFDQTLFVEGGMVHFRRSGWGDYLVRLRVTQDAASLNFNVVRAVDEIEGEISVQDHLAEDRWCTEFPALQKTLAARGMQIEVTRQLEAGEVPVQRVLRDRLPSFAEDEGRRRQTQQLRARDLP